MLKGQRWRPVLEHLLLALAPVLEPYAYLLAPLPRDTRREIENGDYSYTTLLIQFGFSLKIFTYLVSHVL